MLTDRLVQIFLGSIAVLLAGLFMQAMLQSPSQAQVGGYTYPDSSQTYAVRLISEIEVPEGDATVVPIGNHGDKQSATFAIATDKMVRVYLCNFFPKDEVIKPATSRGTVIRR